MKLHTKVIYGPSIKYVTLFLASFDTPSPVTLCHTSRTPPRCLVGLVQQPGQKPLVQILSQLFAEVFVRGFCQRVFYLGGFFPFPLLSEYICYNRNLNNTLNLMFHMYYTNFYKYE